MQPSLFYYPFLIFIFLFSFLEAQTLSKASSDSEMKNVQQKEQKHFVMFGIMERDHSAFQKKYNVSIKYENCVVSEGISKKAKENNKIVAEFLIKKYGNMWKKDLGFTPYGL